MKNMIEISRWRVPPKLPVYSFSSGEELISIVKEVLSTDRSIKEIKLRTEDYLRIRGDYNLLCLYGFGDSMSTTTMLALQGYSLWVYFYKDKVVYATDSCSGTETPPHTATFKDKAFTNLQYDFFNKIDF